MPDSGPAAHAGTPTPAELLRLVPSLLGFHPSEGDLVIIGTRPPGGTVGLTLRFDMPGALPALVVARAASLLAANDCTAAVAIAYGPAAITAAFLKPLRLQDRIPCTGLLCVHGQRYRSLLCTDPACCPPEGTPFDPAPAAPGIPESRDALAAAITPRAGTEATLIRRAHDRAREQIDGHDRPRILRTVRQAIARSRNGHPAPAYRRAAYLATALTDPEVACDAWTRMDPRHRDAHRELWTAVTRLAAPAAVTAPACLLAITAMQSGNGALANLALDRALDATPRDPLARFLQWTIDIGAGPSAFTPPATTADAAARCLPATGTAPRALQAAGPPGPRPRRPRPADETTTAKAPA